MIGVLLSCCVGGLLLKAHLQRRLLADIEDKETSTELEIRRVQLAMQVESDPQKLQALMDRLDLLQGHAAEAQRALWVADAPAAEKFEQQKTAADDWLDGELRALLHRFEADTTYLPPLFKSRVSYYLDDSKRHPATLHAIWARRKLYWPAVENAFRTRGLPEELASVAWVESGFDPLALSSAGARGLWQFMPQTARNYGLRVEPNIDERIDPERAASAAAHYLQDLLSQFGEESFMLAIASYNEGEDGVRRVLMKNGLWHKKDRDFWRLYQLKLLPAETMEYVPRIVAAGIIGRNPARFGLVP